MVLYPGTYLDEGFLVARQPRRRAGRHPGPRPRPDHGARWSTADSRRARGGPARLRRPVGLLRADRAGPAARRGRGRRGTSHPASRRTPLRPRWSAASSPSRWWRSPSYSPGRRRARPRCPSGESLANFAATGATLVVHLAITRTRELMDELAGHYGADCPVVVVHRASQPASSSCAAPSPTSPSRSSSPASARPPSSSSAAPSTPARRPRRPARDRHQALLPPTGEVRVDRER